MKREDGLLAELFALRDFRTEHGIMRRVTSCDLGTRFRAIRHNYKLFGQMVDRGLADWMHDDPYQVGDWPAIFTPIEEMMWFDLRSNCLPFWPQLPVGKFFVDFGNPVLKIAIECDGRNFHDPKKDADRDAILTAMGWKVFRAAGSLCWRNMKHPSDHNDEVGFRDDDYRRRYEEETTSGLIKKVKEAMNLTANPRA